MTERELKAIRSSSQSELDSLMKEHAIKGWKPIGKTEVFNGEYVQPIEIFFDLDDTVEITQDISQDQNFI